METCVRTRIDIDRPEDVSATEACEMAFKALQLSEERRMGQMPFQLDDGRSAYCCWRTRDSGSIAFRIHVFSPSFEEREDG